jgi:membrane fusion protein, multidrug efflux system
MLISRRRYLLLLLTVVLATGCGGDREPVPVEPNTWQTTVITVSEEELVESYSVIGSIVADKRIDISSRITGYIHQVHVREGQNIRHGQLLIVLDNKELDSNIRRAESAVNAARAVLADAEDDLARYQRLLEQGSISAVTVRKTQLQKSTAEENLVSAQAALAAANSQRQYIQIRSPANGIVTTRHLTAGSLATPGVPILTVESRDELKFETFVVESQLHNIKIGDAVDLSIKLSDENKGKNLLPGKVTQITYAGDPVARSYKVSIALPREQGFYSGMFGQAIFSVGKSNNITIPMTALVNKGGLDGVFLVDDENKAWFRWLRVRRHWPGKVEIAAGLNIGERIVGVIPSHIREGDLIRESGSNPPSGMINE